MTAEKMNADNMSRFLDQVSKAHADQFIAMVVYGASSHRNKELEIPKNVSLIRLPPYSPELNPAEQIWNHLRRVYFANRVFRYPGCFCDSSRIRFGGDGSKQVSNPASNKLALD